MAPLNQTSVQIPQAIEQVTQRLAGMFTERILGLIAFGCVFSCCGDFSAVLCCNSCFVLLLVGVGLLIAVEDLCLGG